MHKKNLSKKIFEIINKKNYSKKKIKSLRSQEFSYLGKSSQIIFQILTDFVNEKDTVKYSKYICKPNVNKTFFDKIIKYFKI